MIDYKSKYGEQIIASIQEGGQIYQKVDLNLCLINIAFPHISLVDETTGEDHLLFVFRAVLVL